jgi:hypothetical protein
MANIVRRQQQVAVAPPDQILNVQVTEAERVGIVSVARLQAGAYVTSVALQNATMLSRAANAAFKVSPMGEDVYQAIFMAYGTLAINEIQGLSLRGRGMSRSSASRKALLCQSRETVVRSIASPAPFPAQRP